MRFVLTYEPCIIHDVMDLTITCLMDVLTDGISVHYLQYGSLNLLIIILIAESIPIALCVSSLGAVLWCREGRAGLTKTQLSLRPSQQFVSSQANCVGGYRSEPWPPARSETVLVSFVQSYSSSDILSEVSYLDANNLGRKHYFLRSQIYVVRLQLTFICQNILYSFIR